MFSELDKYSPLGQMRDLLDGITFCRELEMMQDSPERLRTMLYERGNTAIMVLRRYCVWALKSLLSCLSLLSW